MLKQFQRFPSVYVTVSFPNFVDLIIGPNLSLCLCHFHHTVHFVFSLPPEVLSTYHTYHAFAYLYSFWPCYFLFLRCTSLPSLYDKFMSRGSWKVAVLEAHPNSSSKNVTPSSPWHNTLHMPPSSPATLHGKGSFAFVHLFDFSVSSLVIGLYTSGLAQGLI